MKHETKPALLALADGKLFQGISIGIDGDAMGEVVFNTAITGYQEIISDPSYTQQLVTLTHPHIGNVGTNLLDSESLTPRASGVIVRDLSITTSNWRAEESLPDYLKKNHLMGISDVDTRELTRHLRIKGAQNGCITTNVEDPERAVRLAKEAPNLAGLDLAKVVTTPKIYELYPKGEVQLHVVVYDYGVKQNILNLLLERGCHLTVVPAKTPVEDVLAMNPDGIVMSNGPGDPFACTYAIDTAKTLIQKKVPLYGICLGHQILGLASGAQTEKMKFGHHGANHPVEEVDSKKVFITSQNHGFAVVEETLPKNVSVTHRSLFDNTVQGIKLKDAPAFGFQGHPEASPGPHDVLPLFDEFILYAKKKRS